jgi:hypothetical protein
MGRRTWRYGSVPQFDRSKVQEVICISKPDIDYTFNEDLEVGNIYLSDRKVEDMKSYGEVITGDVWNMECVYMGNYFLRDFEFMSEMRERQIASIFDN